MFYLSLFYLIYLFFSVRKDFTKQDRDLCAAHLVKYPKHERYRSATYVELARLVS